MNILKSLWREKLLSFSVPLTHLHKVNTHMLLCMCDSRVSSLSTVITKALSQPDLCASPLAPFLHLSGVPRSNYSRTTKMSEYTKSVNSSLNEKWKPNEKYYYFDSSAPEFTAGMCCGLPCCFWLKQIEGRV